MRHRLRDVVTSAVTRTSVQRFAAAVLPDGSLSRPPVVGRLVLTGDAASKRLRPDPALLLEAACDGLALRPARVRYLLTPAGFLRVRLAPGQARSHGWETAPRDFKTLIDIATYEVSRLLAGSLLVTVRSVAHHLVIGVDLGAPDNHGRPFGETTLVVRTRDCKVVGWTGKSFPNSQQQGHLIRNPDAASHLIEVGRDQVAVLVCHDLVAFGKRGETNRRHSRAGVGHELERAMSGGPTVVLHLPHTTHSMQTWGATWERLLEGYGTSATVWASAVRYRTVNDVKPAAPLPRRLLRASSSGHDTVLDIVLGDYVAL